MKWVVTQDAYAAWEATTALFARVGETDVWIEYLVLPDLEPPAIVIRQYR